jgi:hypothetical protein
MNCNHNCHQGRDCDCNPYRASDAGPVLLIVIAMYLLSLFLWSQL